MAKRYLAEISVSIDQLPAAPFFVDTRRGNGLRSARESPTAPAEECNLTVDEKDKRARPALGNWWLT